MNSDTTALPEELIPTRYSLLSRLKDWDDNESWRVFFDTYWRLIYATALKAGLKPTEAQEVVQETIICVAKDIQKFKRDRRLGTFKGWLRNLTRWRIADQLRKRNGFVLANDIAAGGELQSLDTIPEQPDERLEADWEKEWHANLLEAAMQRVKQSVREEQYQLFDFYVVKEWPVKRITRTLGVSAASVYLAKHRVSRLIQKEVRRLEREWNYR
jgi:RNA polymerase sigma factor (sigma-70 family)